MPRIWCVVATVQRGNGGKLREEALIPLFVAGAWCTANVLWWCACTTGERSTTSAMTPSRSRAVRACRRRPRRRPCLHARADALAGSDAGIAARADRLAATITAESASPGLGAGPGGRCVFRWAAEETRTWSGEVMRLDTEPAAEGRIAYVRRVPKGPVLAISPFNFPSTSSPTRSRRHSRSAPVLLKPAPKTPLSRCCWRRSWRRPTCRMGMLGVVLVENDRAAGLVADPRLRWLLHRLRSGGPRDPGRRPAQARRARTGGNAAAVVCADYAGERDLDWAATRIAAFGTYQAGQSCISVQRVYADTTVYDDLRDRVVKAVGALRTGDPADPHARRPDDRRGRRAPGRVVGAGGRRGGRTAPRRMGEVRRTPLPCWRTSRPTRR